MKLTPQKFLTDSRAPAKGEAAKQKKKKNDAIKNENE